MIHLHLGERERALELLLNAYAIRDAWVVWLGVEPQWDPLRGEPAFEEILRDTAPSGALSQARSAAVAATPKRTKRRRTASRRSQRQILIPTPETQSGENEEARQLYTAGRYYATRRTAEGLRQAIERLERAVELDPEFAIAHAELADCYALLNWYVEPPPAGSLGARQSNLRCAPSKLIRIWLRHMLRSVSSGFTTIATGSHAERELRKAIQLKPSNQVAHRWYAYSLSAMGRHDEAYAEIERARQISPQSAVIATAVANVLFLAGKFDEAVAQCAEVTRTRSGRSCGAHDSALGIRIKRNAQRSDGCV